ncbi:hypothetical protein C8R42DRAFT_590356, partial [Lentinula raphanica]
MVRVEGGFPLIPVALEWSHIGIWRCISLEKARPSSRRPCFFAVVIISRRSFGRSFLLVVHDCRNKLSKCLRQNHNVKTVGDAETLSKMNRTNRHTNRRNCRCTACTDIREQTNCECPYKCYGKARELLDTLPHKWNPLKKQPEDYENERVDDNVEENAHHFDHRMTTEGSLSDAFRIFTEGEECNETLLQEWNNTDEQGPVVVYTDGSCMSNGSDEALAGSGVHFPNGEYEDQAIRLPNEMRQTNQTGEIIAIKAAADTVSKHKAMVIKSD